MSQINEATIPQGKTAFTKSRQPGPTDIDMATLHKLRKMLDKEKTPKAKAVVDEADSVTLKDLEGYDQQTASVAADIKAKYPNAPDALSAVLGFIADIRDASKRDEAQTDKDLEHKKKHINDLEQRIYDLEKSDTPNRKNTMENQINEGVLDDADEDGWMAKSQLYKLAKYAISLHGMISDTDNLEPWVQAKITRASEDMSSVKHYLEYQAVNPHGEQPNEPEMSIEQPMPSDDVEEGYEVLPSIDRDKYQERPGLEGPFQTRSGKVVYYDPKEGSYYDPTSDMYISYDDWRKLDSKTMHSTGINMEARSSASDQAAAAGAYNGGKSLAGNGKSDLAHRLTGDEKQKRRDAGVARMRDEDDVARKAQRARFATMSEEVDAKKMDVTDIDKKGNTPAYQQMKKGNPRYVDKTTKDVKEGKSPHKKGTEKYKKHMAAMHAEGVQETKEAIEQQAIDFFTSIKSKIGNK